MIKEIVRNQYVKNKDRFRKSLEAFKEEIHVYLIEEANIKQEKLEGGYGNPVEFFQIAFTRKKEIDKVIQNIVLKLPDDVKKSLAEEFNERFDSDKSTFYLRVKKELAIRDKLQITSSSNAIKVAIKLRSFVKGVDFKEFLLSLGILS